MVIKLEFDVYYTVIKIPMNLENFNPDDVYDEFDNWMMKDSQYYVETQYGYSFSFNDDVLIKWLQEIRFRNYKIEVLEKHFGIDEISNYNPDLIMYF